jgi:hypothetical protein
MSGRPCPDASIGVVRRFPTFATIGRFYFKVGIVADDRAVLRCRIVNAILDKVICMGHNFRFDVDVNVINHLGVGLYSSTPAALTELVANAWDADAKEVTIDIDPLAGSIVIQDDGHGMTPDEIQRNTEKVPERRIFAAWS